jgi:methyl-accepting chemotaxis protein
VPVELSATIGALALVAMAVAMILIALLVLRLSSDVRRLLASSERLVDETNRDLPGAIAEVRSLASSLRNASDGLEPRLDRLDRLADEAEATLVTVRTAAESVGEVVNGPLAAIGGVSRGLRGVAEGIGVQASRLRRARRSSGSADEWGEDEDGRSDGDR